MDRIAVARVFFAREVGWAMVAVGAVVFLAFAVPVRALQAPGSVVIVGFAHLQHSLLPGVGGDAFVALFAVYCYLVAVALGNALRLVLRTLRPARARRGP